MTTAQGEMILSLPTEKRRELDIALISICSLPSSHELLMFDTR